MMNLSAWYSGWRMWTVGRLKTRLFSLHHAHLKIANGIGWTLCFVIIARLIGAGREMALAAHYGVSEVIDAYLFVFNLLSWPFTVWFNVLSIVLVPTVIKLRGKGDVSKTLQHFRAGLLGISLLIGVAFAILFWLAFGTGMFLPYIGFPPSTAELTRGMIFWLTPIVPLGFVVSFYSAWVMATGRYVNTLIEAVPPLAILLAIFFLPDGKAAPLVSGTLLGFILQALILLIVLRKKGETTAPVFVGSGSEWRQFWKNFGLIATGNTFVTASIVIDQVMAAALDPGTIATLSYANRIVALMLSLSALTVSRAMLPIFSGMRAALDPRLSRVAMQWMALLFFGSALVTFAAWWCAPSAIALLFQRGAFKAENTRAVVELFSFALIQIPFYCGGLTLATLFAASGRYRIMMLIAVASLMVKLIMNWLFIPLFGAAGIVLATSIMYAFSFVAKTLVTLSLRA
jgi:putative peptidoglycan lipid II flippase